MSVTPTAHGLGPHPRLSAAPASGPRPWAWTPHPRPGSAPGKVPSRPSADDPPGSSSVSGAPDSSHRMPDRQSDISAISYDYSEEQLMASIEREYCR
ncbi:cystin-1 [Crocuta crocuta]